MTLFYTIGYGGRHPRENFLATLSQHHIAIICDVRAEPRRAYRGIYTFNPEKGSGPLPRLLAHAGIAYRWFPELGNPDRHDPHIQAFQDLMASDGQRRLQPLQACIEAGYACLLCAEQAPQRCHRQIITAYLLTYGYSVQHL
jgi:uncharacterized protein (DUF488 family)